jgi:hypothetical protein
MSWNPSAPLGLSAYKCYIFNFITLFSITIALTCSAKQCSTYLIGQQFLITLKLQVKNCWEMQQYDCHGEKQKPYKKNNNKKKTVKYIGKVSPNSIVLN